MTETQMNAANDKPFRRPVSPLERVFIAMESSLAAERSVCYVQQVVEGIGDIDIATLRDAVKKASMANPGTRLVLKGYGRWLQWQATDRPTEVVVIENSLWNGFTVEHAEFLFRPFNFRNGPTTEVLWLPGPTPRLILRVHHSFMDGGGIMMFMADIFRCLRGEAPLGADSTATETDFMKKPTPDLETRRRFDAPLVSGGARCQSPLGYLFQRRETPAGKDMPLCAAIECLADMAFAKNPEATEAYFMVPADLRGHEKTLRSTGNMTSTLQLTVKRGETAADVSRALRVSLRKQEARQRVYVSPWVMAISRWLPIWFFRLMLNIYRWRRQRGQLGFMFTASVSFAPKMPLAEYQCPGFSARVCYGIPSLMSTGALLVGILDNGPVTEITATCPEYTNDPETLTQILDAIAARISRQ